MKKEIIEKLKSHKLFRNPNIISNLVFEPLEVDEEKKTIKVNCIDRVSGYSHIEVWDDWDITLNAFLLGEYKFL
jgi:hypothetical protein